MQTKQDVLSAVERIRKTAHHDELAHELEDKLYREFIEFIARHNDELGEMARIVLSTGDIEFSRWYT